jgi:ribonuclease P protein component
MKKYGLPRKQMLKSPLKVSYLFTHGQAMVHYPFRIMWLRNTEDPDERVSVAFSVGKRYYRKAPDRNRIKRLMREVYRKQQPAFHQQLETVPGSLRLVIVYTGRQIYSYNYLYKAWEETWQKLCSKFG